MYFLNPGAFWALSLVAIPILIHLFNLRRVKKIYFSDLRFLKNVDQQRRSKSTIRKVLVLICRILAITFLVIAFAQPILISDKSTDPLYAPVIYLDNSLSLQRTDLSGNLLLVNAVTSVEGLLSNFPKGLGTALITNQDFARKFEPSQLLIDKVQKIDYSSRSIDVQHVFELMERLNGKELYFFSDFQKSTNSLLPKIIEDTTRLFTLFQLQSPIQKNLFVDTVYLDKPMGLSGSVELNMSVVNTGDEQVSDVLVKLFKENAQLASFTITIDSHDTESLSLELGATDQSSGKYAIQIDESPVVFDNNFYFSIARKKSPLVVILSDERENDYLSNVFKRKEYFRTVHESINNTSFQNIIDADLLILDHLSTIPNWLISQLSQFKGRLLVCPSKNVDIESYNKLLGFTISSSENENSIPISSKSLKNPLFEGVFQEEDQYVNLPDVVHDYVISGYYEPILITQDNSPYLVRNGAVYFFSGAFEEDVKFPVHALFVPVMYKLAESDHTAALYYRLDEGIIHLSIDSIDTESLYQLRRNDDVYVPEVRYDSDGIMIGIPEVMNQPGVYYLTTNRDTLATVAFNYQKKESLIECYTASELQEMISGYDHVDIEEISDVQEFIQTRREEAPGLWKYALILALFFIISEILLLRFIS